MIRRGLRVWCQLKESEMCRGQTRVRDGCGGEAGREGGREQREDGREQQIKDK